MTDLKQRADKYLCPAWNVTITLEEMSQQFMSQQNTRNHILKLGYKCSIT